MTSTSQDFDSVFAVTEIRTPTITLGNDVSSDYTDAQEGADTHPSQSSVTSAKGGRRGSRGSAQQKRNATPPERKSQPKSRRYSYSELSQLKEDMLQSLKQSLAELIKEAIAPLQSTIAQLHSTLSDKTEQYNNLKEQFDKTEQERVNLLNRIEQVEEKTDALEQYSRRSCIRLYNVDPKTENDDLTHLVQDISKKTGANITQQNIVKCHWLGKPNGKKNRQVIVKFVDEKIRDCFLKCKAALRGDDRFGRIQIREDLTKTRYGILSDLLNLRRDKKIFSAWSFNGVLHYKVTEDGPRGSLTTTKEYRRLVQELMS